MLTCGPEKWRNISSQKIVFLAPQSPYTCPRPPPYNS
uniref:Uncharacterized protein n=1 Tax=Anguilla anguilla TaxID=7936 RepID=A0A0E9TYB0_ANGAN